MRGGFFFVDVGVKRYVKMCDTHPLRASATFFCVDLVRHEACVKYTTYVDARTTRAKMPISLKEMAIDLEETKDQEPH
ncbi:MAG: hypothetical protein IPK76_06915 [Lewinellaceae bacterium]|nr:hypothetical protein [Lewinellaceae bacterium]